MTSPNFDQPLYLHPCFSERPWGGDYLARLYGKDVPPGKIIGESWEVADRPAAQSVVMGGPFDGWTLRRLLETDAPSILGALAGRATRFPLLAKFIDAAADLSVQVHPDDDGAKLYNDCGKTECWIVLRAEPGARIIRGLNTGVSREAFQQAVKEDRIETVLHSFTARVGDLVALPPGMIHALGAGLVVAEIQQNSDLTFRIYDYKRLGLDGKSRQLHIAQALGAIRFDAPGDEFDGDMSTDIVAPQTHETIGAVTVERLLRGRYFGLERYTLSAGGVFKLLPLPQAPRILMALSGFGTLNGRPLRCGQTVLLPAAAQTVELAATPDTTLVLAVSAPELL
ncbi:MAG: type I phosphomannose isomerase catalytic subunit [Planctomycetota bacterium]